MAIRTMISTEPEKHPLPIASFSTSYRRRKCRYIPVPQKTRRGVNVLTRDRNRPSANRVQPSQWIGP